MLPTLRRMPFPGPAKEQRATYDRIQVGNDEKSQRKERFETNDQHFCETIVRTKPRARHTNLDGESQSD